MKKRVKLRGKANRIVRIDEEFLLCLSKVDGKSQIVAVA